MQANERGSQKRAVEQLNFGTKTSKRATWEAWEFTIVGPHQIEVTNASYGIEKDEHSYIVCVEVRNGVVVPAECECPADKHSEEYDCKHKVSLATVGGPTVLNAAAEFLSVQATPDSKSEPVPKPDGGVLTTETDPETCPNGEDGCSGPDGENFPCFDCYCDREESTNQ